MQHRTYCFSLMILLAGFPSSKIELLTSFPPLSRHDTLNPFPLPPLQSSYYALRTFPSSFLTFIQFVFVAAQTLPTQITFNKTTKRIGRDGEAVVEESKGWIPRLKTRKVPLKRWAVQVVLFLAVSWLNNYAFSFNVSPGARDVTRLLWTREPRGRSSSSDHSRSLLSSPDPCTGSHHLPIWRTRRLDAHELPSQGTTVPSPPGRRGPPRLSRSHPRDPLRSSSPPQIVVVILQGLLSLRRDALPRSRSSLHLWNPPPLDGPVPLRFDGDLAGRNLRGLRERMAGRIVLLRESKPPRFGAKDNEL